MHSTKQYDKLPYLECRCSHGPGRSTPCAPGVVCEGEHWRSGSMLPLLRGLRCVKLLSLRSTRCQVVWKLKQVLKGRATLSVPPVRAWTAQTRQLPRWTGSTPVGWRTVGWLLDPLLRSVHMTRSLPIHSYGLVHAPITQPNSLSLHPSHSVSSPIHKPLRLAYESRL